MLSRTYGKLHFSDLEPGRFEMLAMQIIYRMRRWERLDHYGDAGSDDGIDINAVELLENGKRHTHHFQCKRYDRINKSQLVKIVANYIADNPEPADYYYLVCGCNPSKTAIDAFNFECEKRGFKHYYIWSASYIETLLYSHFHDILFAYFGINLSEERDNFVNAIRRNIALKKRMHKDFTKQNLSNADLHAIRYEGEYWKRFIHSEVLVRSFYDKKYPDNNPDMPGYFKAEIYDWYHNGIEVRAHPYAVNAKVRQLKQGAEIGSSNPDDYESMEYRLEVFGCIPFENIIDYDIDGDEYYSYPHLFCDYTCGSDPYEEKRYRTNDGRIINKADIIEFI